ncbi:MAG: 50S ribosome-binding GTPase [Elusimicrobia bacterium]|nr:50S ribosome-binding GTPase [Elusimicrobiota bacterium]
MAARIPQAGIPSGQAVRRLALVGRPNVGKSVLFHALTGRYAAVSNYSGTTLDLRRAPGAAGTEVIDTPGLFSLDARSDDEAATRDLLCAGGADLVIQVASACDPEGALVMAYDLSRLGLPTVLVLNLADEAEGKGIRTDAAALEARLGVPVVLTAATKRRGVPELLAALERAAAVRPPPLPAEVVGAVGRLEPALGTRALGLFAGDDAGPSVA